MPEDDGRGLTRSARYLEPRNASARSELRRAAEVSTWDTIGRARPQGRQAPGNDAQTLGVREPGIPDGGRLIPIETLEKRLSSARAKSTLHLSCQLLGRFDAPFREESRVDEEVGIFTVQQRAPLQPFEQLVAVGRLEHFVQRIPGFRDPNAFGERQQVKVMVAQNRGHAVTEALRPAQYCKGVGASIDHIADQPEPISQRIEVDLLEKETERLEASLYVADCVSCHVRSNIINNEVCLAMDGLCQRFLAVVM